MLNVFPDILFLGHFYVPLILRATIGLVFVWMAYQHLFKNREEATRALQKQPFVISFLAPLARLFIPYSVWILGIGEAIIGIAFIVGFLTQVAALLAIVVLLKMLLFRQYLRAVRLYSPVLYLLLIAIALSLFLSGAGALAFDIPL